MPHEERPAMMQGGAGNDVAVKADHPITQWIKDQAKNLSTSGKDCTLWPDFIKPAPNFTLQFAAPDFALIGSKAIFWDPQALWGDAVNSACTSCVNCPGKGQRDGPFGKCAAWTPPISSLQPSTGTSNAQVSSLDMLTSFHVCHIRQSCNL